ncbi:HMA domain-containing protein [Citrus sinensis]|nr:HMA domain-containing protein [Citrus sinensis]
MRVRGLMCQSTAAATAVCMPNDSASSVIVPRSRRPPADDHYRNTPIDDDHTRLIKYSKLIDNSHHPPSSNYKRSLHFVPSTSSIKRQAQDDIHSHHDPKPKPNPKSMPLIKLPLASSGQVVVMRVSLHCQGCAGKLKKHLSKMEGVTSFSIDLETKRVTVMGHISPTGVLESISKVKRAEFWPC